MTNTKSLTRNLSSRARLLFDELLAVAQAHRHLLSGRGGMFLVHEVFTAAGEQDAARYTRTFRALPPREQRRLLQALPNAVGLDALNAINRHVANPAGRAGSATAEDGDDLDVSVIAPHERDQARRDFAAHNIRAFLGAELADPAANDVLSLVVRNAGPLAAHGLYEPALVRAFRQGVSVHWTGPTLQWLFALGDPDRLRAQGDPLPGAGPFDVYRGGGHGHGLSWSSDPVLAALFAAKSETPAIRRATLAATDVRVYFASAAVGVGLEGPNRRVRRSWMPWLSRRSDEFLAARDPGGTALDDDETADLIARVTAI
jgi:hypothetical protein